MKVLGIVAASIFCCATALAAQEQPPVYVDYKIKMDGSLVRGRMMVARLVDGEEVTQGYQFSEVIGFITEDCASGKIGKVKIGKKRYAKNRAHFHKSFRLSCIGGPHPDIGGVTVARVRIERQDDGRDLAKYTYFKDGDQVTVQRYR